jgi:hypothetical protein
MPQERQQQEFADGLRNVKQAILEALSGISIKATEK